MSLTIPTVNLAAIGPELALTVGALILLLLSLGRYRRSTGLLLAVALGSLAVAFALVIAAWKAPVEAFAGSVALDRFAVGFSLAILSAATLTVLLSLNELERSYLLLADYYGLVLFATVGMLFLASATSLVMVFVGLETLSISLYVLAGQRRTQASSLEAALKYFLLGAFATGFFLYGVALIYGATGTLQLREIGTYVGTHGIFGSQLFAFGVLLLLIGFGFKIAVVPFHMWTPDVYQGAPTPVSGFMAAGSKAAAFAALVRIVFVAVGPTVVNWTALLWVLAVLTMFVGNVLAVVQDNVKRMLAYSSIAHAGYILVAIVAANDLTNSSVIFYVLTYTFMNVGAFGVLSALASRDKEALDVHELSGVGYQKPLLGLAMAIFMFSLAGVPPTAGFMAKFYVFSAAVKAGYIWLAILGVVAAMISVYYYLRVVVYLYMREPDGETTAWPRLVPAVGVALGVAVLAILGMGVWPGSVMGMLRQAAALL